MIPRESTQRCVLMLIADGFEEAETIVLLSALRQAGLCVKCVGLTSGLVSSAHGVWLRPDLAFADLDPLLQTTAISLLILPRGKLCLARLEADPRVHKLLGRVIEQQGQIVTGPDGLPLARAAAVKNTEPEEPEGDWAGPLVLYNSAKSLETFVQNLIRRLLSSD